MKLFSILLVAFIAFAPIRTFQKTGKADQTTAYYQLNSESLKKFSSYPIVTIGEGNHNNALKSKWLKTLIVEKAFQIK